MAYSVIEQVHETLRDQETPSRPVLHAFNLYQVSPNEYFAI